MPHAFVSYVREDREVVDRLARTLRREGVEVWLDRDSIRPGTPWREAIEAAIRGGAYFIACLSRTLATKPGSFMWEELDLAVDRLAHRADLRTWFVPLRLDGGGMPDLARGGRAALAAIEQIDLAADWEDGVRRLLGVLQPDRSYGRCLNEPPARGGALVPEGADGPLLALDFGTSHSSMAYHAAGTWIAVPDAARRTLIPSVVAFTPTWDYVVGWEALAEASRDPARAVFHAKRLVYRGEDARVGHKRFSGETIAALVVKHLRVCAESWLGAPVRRVLLSAPVNYAHAAALALVRVCESAGLAVRRVVSEPNAASLSAVEWMRRRRATAAGAGPATFLVLDVGGGTTDASVVVVDDPEDAVVEVVASAGDNLLGGMDYDEAVLRALRAAAIDPLVRDGLRWSPVDDHRLRLEVSRAKSSLRDRSSTTLVLGELEHRERGLVPVEVELTREAFRAAVAPLDRRVEDVIRRVEARRARVGSRERYRAVLLAGQGARIFTLADRLEDRYPATPLVTEFQESAVVRGLGGYAGVLSRRRRDLLLLDAIGRTLALSATDRGSEPPLDHVDVCVSVDGARNVRTFALSESGATVPLRSTTRIRVDGDGDLLLSFGEVDLLDDGVTAPLVTLTVPARRHGEVLRLDLDVDQDRTYVAMVRDAAGRQVVRAQLNNPFLPARSSLDAATPPSAAP